ncbi:MAG: DUF1573 domain-containing protein [Prevotellaceae bacterium]|jgi:hypothetical protein|nr:DUF1573 domain-containing protein [Prevotellaceae bacterium]
MKTRCFILWLMTSVAVAAYAQGPFTIVFDKTSHNFGEIDQKGGPQTFSFEFTNKGTEPIVIQNVTASCGCTSPDWTKTPVPPGGRGFVKATYTPSAVMPFNKSLTVYSNGTPSPQVLHISGKVVAQAPRVEEQYPVAVGALRLRKSEISLGRIAQGASKRDSVEVINTGDEPLTLAFTNVPKHAAVELVPATLQKNEKGFIRSRFNTAAMKSQEWGIVKHAVGLTINGKAQDTPKLTIAATIEDDFSKLTPADYENAPAVSLKETTYNFNTIKTGTKVTAEFELTNTGKSPLLIHKAYAECACLKVSAPKSVKAGATAVIKAVLDTKGEEGNNIFYSITLSTNSPSQSAPVLMITGTVTK